jgi:hypothetical protein
MEIGLKRRAATVASLIAVLAASCSTLGEDEAARGAPQLDGLGRSEFVVTATDAEAKALFQVLSAQGRTADAQGAAQRLSVAWGSADPDVRRLMQSG